MRATQQRNAFQEKCMKPMKHLTMSQQELLGERRTMREAVKPLPDMHPDDWRYVVVLGPAGHGKSSFIREQLSQHGYPELAVNVIVSHTGTGTFNKPAPYIMAKHKVVLFDSVGDAAASLHGEALAADVLVVFMEKCRGERVHGDAAVLAYRLQHRMHTIFVVSKADQQLAEERKCGLSSGPTEFVAGIRRKAWLELQRELSLSKGKCVLDRAREAGLELEEVNTCVGSLLRAARDLTEGDFGAWCERQHWLDVVSYCCSLAFGSAGTYSAREGANDFEAERERLRDRLFPRETPAAISGAPLTPPDLAGLQEDSLAVLFTHLRVDQQLGFKVFAAVERLNSPVLSDCKAAANEFSTIAARKTADGDGAATTAAVIAAGGVPALVRLLSSTDSGMQQEAAKALSWVAHTAAGQAAVIAAGGVPALVRLLSSTDSRVQKQAAIALGWVAHVAAGQAAVIADDDGVPALVLLSSSTTDNGVQWEAASALSWVARVAAGQAAVIAAGGVPALVQLLSSSDCGVQKQAAIALGWVAHVAAGQAAIIADDDGVPALKVLLSSTDKQVHSAAHNTLRCGKLL